MEVVARNDRRGGHDGLGSTVEMQYQIGSGMMAFVTYLLALFAGGMALAVIEINNRRRK